MSFVGIDDVVPEDVASYILTFLDVPTLVRKKAVCRSWQIRFTNTIHQKASTPKAFQSRAELKAAVNKYVKYNLIDAEDFAETYGWPIGRWDVSLVEDFSYLFYEKLSFDENIGSWDVSSATSMIHMFRNAIGFNQDLSSWNVSNVKDMHCMFENARSFNQDISSWNVSNVNNMCCMFENATSFNQDISSWDVSNVDDMSFMFAHATSLNRIRRSEAGFSCVTGQEAECVECQQNASNVSGRNNKLYHDIFAWNIYIWEYLTHTNVSQMFKMEQAFSRMVPLEST